MYLKIEVLKDFRNTLDEKERLILTKELIRYYKPTRITWLNNTLLEIEGTEPVPLNTMEMIRGKIQGSIPGRTTGFYFAFSYVEITFTPEEKKQIDTLILSEKLTS